MPTYTYRCQSCGHQFDIFQKFADDPLKECPECHGSLRKVLHPVGVVFKGSGWYINDSRPAQAGENGGSDKAESDKSDKKDKAAAGSTNGKSGDTAKTAASTESTSTTAKSDTKPKAAASSES
jgi:putative FmdB family regulatory protein